MLGKASFVDADGAHHISAVIAEFDYAGIASRLNTAIEEIMHDIRATVGDTMSRSDAKTCHMIHLKIRILYDESTGKVGTQTGELQVAAVNIF
jgi:hypothetical protein